jgi:hypothetical protein
LIKGYKTLFQKAQTSCFPAKTALPTALFAIVFFSNIVFKNNDVISKNFDLKQ